ncbi:MAG: hypothetical protein C0625_08385 [Arcobacter sp.]|nr:MAG: hypothetical protein C0625_08385 [Arcobacter sp.]
MSIEDQLNMIPKIFDIVLEMREELEYLTPDLTKCKGVSQYLNKTEKTIYNYIDTNKFILNYHYFRKNGKIFFVEEKIKEFRRIYRSKTHFTLIDEKFKKVN